MSGASSQWVLVALVAAAAAVALTSASPAPSRQLLQLQEAQPELSPEAAAQLESDESPLDRDKRKVLELKLGAGFGVKHFLLDLIFGKINQVIDYKTAKVAQLDQLNVRVKAPATVAPPRSTTPEDIVEFPRTRVSLQLPDELFGNSFTLITNVSRIFGSLIMNSAERKQQLVEAVKPYVAAKLRIDTRVTTTTEPIESLVPRLGPPLGGSTNDTATDNAIPQSS